MHKLCSDHIDSYALHPPSTLLCLLLFPKILKLTMQNYRPTFNLVLTIAPRNPQSLLEHRRCLGLWCGSMQWARFPRLGEAWSCSVSKTPKWIRWRPGLCHYPLKDVAAWRPSRSTSQQTLNLLLLVKLGPYYNAWWKWSPAWRVTASNSVDWQSPYKGSSAYPQ